MQRPFDTAVPTRTAVWVAADLPNDDVNEYEEPDSQYLGYRSVGLSNEVLSALVWREMPPAEVAERSRRRGTHPGARAPQRRSPGLDYPGDVSYALVLLG
jgi:hypothetical protein